MAFIIAGHRASAVDLSPSQAPTELEAVSASSATDAWAVGYRDYGAAAVILHWDGMSWSPVANPAPAGTELLGVDAISPSDVWAVGSSSRPRSHTLQTVTLHWDGSTWAVVASPNASTFVNRLEGVSIISATNAWAVGVAVTPTHKFHALVLHWNGTRWSTVPAPGAELHAVTAVSSRNAWAVGFGTLLHWNGKRWSKQTIRTANFLQSVKVSDLIGVGALSASNVFAVGSRCAHHGGCTKRTDIIHWNGRHWAPVPSPAPTRWVNVLNSVSVRSAKDAWAVGAYCTTSRCTAQRTLIVHWNGKRWSKVQSPNPGSFFDALAGTAAVSSTQAWAVGASASGHTESNPLTLAWDGSNWTSL